jgi:hypothetical protein
MSSLDFNLVGWLERNHGSPEERATFGELEIHAGGVCLTEVDDRGARTTRTAIRVSLFHLADWLLWNRWRLLSEPDCPDDPEWSLSHQIGGAGGGFLWPHLTFSSDGETIRVVQATDERPHSRMIRYLNGAEALVPIRAFEIEMDRLVEMVLNRLGAAGLRNTHLSGLHEAVQAERADPSLASLRRHEALLGLDPDEVDSSEVLKLRTSAAWLGSAASDEVLAEARFAKGREVLEWLKAQSVAPDLSMDLRDLVPFALGGGSDPTRGHPWERGAALAHRVREGLGLGTEPVDLDALVHATVGAVPALPDRHFAAGFVGTSESLGVALKRRSGAGRRFEVARIVGDALLRPESDRVLPATDRATVRQKIQRAFAQELLSPIEGLKTMVSLPNPREGELEDAADHYGVSPWTVRSALVNRELVGREYLPR